MENFMRREVFHLNTLSTDELRLKWHEIFNTKPPINLRKNYLVKEIAYGIQYLRGCSNTSQEEVNTLIKVTNRQIKNNSDDNSSNPFSSSNKRTKKKTIIMLPPSGSVITKVHKDTEYRVQVISENKFECNGVVYKSLSALALAITGTKWNGYVFFGLKKKVN